MSRFRSKLDGMNRAKGAWLCACGAITQAKVKRCKCGAVPDYFPSRRELNRAVELRIMEKAGTISGLEFHPRYDLRVNGRKITTYVADSRYVENSRVVVEDVKPRSGFIEPIARLKMDLFEACHYPLKVRIV